MKRYAKTLLKSTAIIGIGNFATKFLMLLLVPLHTMWISTSDYGEYDLLNSLSSFIVPLITVLLDQAILRFALNDRKRPKDYLINSLYAILPNIIIANLIILLFSLFNNQLHTMPFIVFLDSYAIYQCCSEYLRGVDKLVKYASINIIISATCLIFNIVFVYSIGIGVDGILLASSVSYIFGILLILISEKILLSYKKVQRKLQKTMLQYSAALIPNSLGWWVTNVSDRLIINLAMSSYSNGIYAVACKIPTFLTLSYGIFNLAWQQTIFMIKNSHDRESLYHAIYYKLIRTLFALAIIILLVTIVIFKFMLSSDYSSAYLYVPILLGGVIFLSLSQFLTGIFLTDMDSKSVGRSMIVAAIVNLIIDVSAIWSIGLFAASLSTLFAYITLFCVRFWKLRKYFDVRRVAMELTAGIALFTVASVVYYLIGGSVL